MPDTTDIIRRSPLLIEQEPAEEESSFLGVVGSGLLSGLGMLGNLLDLPASMVRDVAVGANPFDQFLDPLSHYETGSSTGGREMLARNPLTGLLFTENKETGMAGWFDDPLEGVQDIAGFAAELALDPFSWMTGWGKAAGTTAKAATGTARSGGKITRAVTETLDKAGDVVNTLDPGYHVGKMMKKKLGPTVEPIVRRGQQKTAVKLNRGKQAVQEWANKYELPSTPIDVLRKDLDILKRKSSAASDADVVTQLNPVQQLARRVGAAFGSDVNFYGGGKESGGALGVSINDFSNRVWVSADQADAGIINVVGHETLHLMRNADPDAFEDLLGSILETVENPQRFMKEAMESYPGWDNLRPEIRAEEGVAMLAGAAFEDPAIWTRLAEDPTVEPIFRRAFRDTMKIASKHLTTGEAGAINELMSEFMFAQREVSAGGSDLGRLAKGKLDSIQDLDRIDKYQHGMAQVFSRNTDQTKIQRATAFADDKARQAVRNTLDISDRIGKALTGQMNYKVLGRTTIEGQAMGRLVTGKFEDVGPMLAEPVMAISNELVTHGLLDNIDVANDIRRAVENDEYQFLSKHFANPEDSENFQTAVRQLKKTIAKVVSMGEDAGMKKSILDDIPDWFARGMSPKMTKALEAIEGANPVKGSDKLFSAASSGKRTNLFRGAVYGTDTFNDITGDRDIINAVAHGRKDIAAKRIRKGWGGELDPRMPHTKRTADGTQFLIRDFNGEMRYIDEAELFREYEKIDPGIDMRGDAAGRINEYKQPLKMSRKSFTADDVKMKDLLEMDGGDLIEMGIDGDLVGGLDDYELGSFTPEEMEDFADAIKAEYAEKASAAQDIELVTHLTPILKEQAEKFRIAGGEVPDRAAVLSDWMSNKGILKVLEEEGGVFRNNPLAEVANRLQAEAYKYSVADSLPKLFSQLFTEGKLAKQTAGIGEGIHGSTLKQIFDKDYAHLDRKKIYQKMRKQNKGIQELANENPDTWMDMVGDMHIPREIADDLLTVKDFMQLPDSVQGVMNLFRSSTAAFKAGVLTAPARYTRDFFSGQIANYLNNMFSFESAVRAKDVLMNNPNEALTTLDQLRDYAQRNGMAKTVADGEDWFTPDVAVKSARELFASLKGDASNIQRDANLEEVGRLFTEASAAEQVAEALPGTHQSFGDLARDLRDFVIMRKGSKNPINIEGVQYFTGSKAKERIVRRRGQEGFEEFGPVQAGNILNKNSDDMNRLVGWLEGMRQGKSAKEAFADVTRVQLDYRPHTFGPLEKVALKKIFPFYSFFSRQSAYLANELMTNPAGRLGKLIRLQHEATSVGGQDEEYVPEHVRSQMAIPIGQSNDGGKNYITGIGLMHEDPISTIMGGAGDPQAGARNVLSKMNPIVKGLAEYGLGRSSFQGGPLGGRDLADMDPSVGRILTQLGIQDPTPSGRAAPFISRGFEFAVSNSPISRVVSSTKTALDSRKNPLERAVNLLTGLRITTVSPEQSRSALRDIGNAIARDAGARSFETFHIPQNLIDYFDDDPETQAKLKAINAKREQWNKQRRAEIRRKKAEKSSP